MSNGVSDVVAPTKNAIKFKWRVFYFVSFIGDQKLFSNFLPESYLLQNNYCEPLFQHFILLFCFVYC